MADVQKGKFCGSCQKQVVDFTNMSDRQLAEFFKKPSTGSVCGRFMTDQLERELDIPKKRIPWLKYFFTIAIPAFFASKAAGQQTHKIMGKPAFRQPRDTIRIVTVPEVRKLGEVAPEIITIRGNVTAAPANMISGTITNEKGEVVEGVSITVAGTKIAATSDMNGAFKITAKKGDVLSVSAIGYQAKDVIVNEKSSIAIQLTPIILEEVVVVGYVTKTRCDVIMGAISTVRAEDIRKVDDKEVMKQPDAVLKIYPNPVQRNTTFTVRLKKMSDQVSDIRIITASGVSVLSQKMASKGKQATISLQAGDWAAGLYFIQLLYADGQVAQSERLVIQ